MHGIGNDYVYFDCFGGEDFSPESVAAFLSDRHFGVGGDGIILVERSAIADGKMRMFNADGSEGKMCGNGIRCVGKFLYDYKGVKKDKITVETLSGVKTLTMQIKDGVAVGATVDMGEPVLEPEKIPARFEKKPIVNAPLTVCGKEYRVTVLSMGNPHCVVFGADLEGLEIQTVGKAFERHEAFPDRVNTEFVRQVGNNEFEMRVWERGSGETLACGTGACAVAVAAVWNGYAKRGEEILVHLLGGDLTITVTEKNVFLTGSAQTAFVGEVEIG